MQSQVTCGSSLPVADPSQLIKARFPDLPSDLVLNRYSIPTYANLEDAIDVSHATDAIPVTRSKRHDSYKPISDTKKLYDVEQISEIVQGLASESSSDTDVGFDFEISVKQLGTEPKGLPHTGGDDMQVTATLQNTDSCELSQVDGPCHSSGIMTAGVQDVLDNLTPAGCSGSECSVSESKETRRERRKLKRSSENTAFCSEALYPEVPPEPQLEPVRSPGLSFEHSIIPNIPLDNSAKRHVRSRTYPLRLRPASRPLAFGEQSQSQKQLQVPTLARTAQNGKSDTHHYAPHLTGFDHLPAPKVVENPAHLPTRIQLHSHLRSQPPPKAQSHNHLSSIPATYRLPLPRRESNPPPTIDATHDAFYNTLRSKLWDLAKELETRQPEEPGTRAAVSDLPSPDRDDEISLVFKLDMDDSDGERDAIDADIDTDSTPNADEEEENSGSGNTVKHHKVNLNPHAHSRSHLEKGNAMKSRHKSHPQFCHLEVDLSDGSDDSLCGSDVDEIVNWVRAKPVLANLQRRRSEGRGRLRAKERAQGARQRWMRGGD